jgi:hypothetical protein
MLSTNYRLFVGSLRLFKHRLYLFSSTYKLFLADRGVGGVCSQTFKSHPYSFHTQKGEKPRIAWGEAIRSLGVYIEDWAVRSSLKLSVARPL